mmetsp:Transcript_53106/g.168549  ORF Transcript_53106/g.168549 Transcript_53106/m.168549 type:complete len:471 (-) Transcript_53106:207-1619(-)
MTEVDDDIKYGMIEAISHLIHRDYEAIVEDFVTLDFIPDGVDLKPILPVLAKVFDSALEGGGAKNFNFQELAADLAQITFDYPFRIPPYFALIIRAIGVLEGIALVGNPDFALVDEAYPYISKRLLTDDSPRLRQSLRYMVYGRGKVFDAERLIDILEAFEEFSKASKSAYGNLGVPLPTAEHAAHSEDAAHSSKDAAASAKKSKETQRLRGGIPGLVAVPSPFGGSVLVPKDLVPAGFPTTSVSAAGGGGDMVDLPSPFGGTVQVPRALVPPGVSIPGAGAGAAARLDCARWCYEKNLWEPVMARVAQGIKHAARACAAPAHRARGRSRGRGGRRRRGGPRASRAYAGEGVEEEETARPGHREHFYTPLNNHHIHHRPIHETGVRTRMASAGPHDLVPEHERDDGRTHGIHDASETRPGSFDRAVKRASGVRHRSWRAGGEHASSGVPHVYKVHGGSSEGQWEWEQAQP